MSFLFKKSFWESAGKGLKSLVSGEKKSRVAERREMMAKAGIQPTGKTVFEMDAGELWKTGLGNALATAGKDPFAKTNRGKVLKKVGEAVGAGIHEIGKVPGVGNVISNAEKVTTGVLGGPKKMADLALQEIKNRGVSTVLGNVIPSSVIDRAKSLIPSMATGGVVRAPPRKGKLVRLHNNELVIPARKSKLIQRVAKRNGIEIPMRRR
jgi:hypothetical protein